MFNLEAVSAQRLYRLIAERIAEKIRAGEFAVGARLPAERDLAEVLQVSRSSVREALIALELSGYIEVRVGSGVYVTATRGNDATLSAMPSVVGVGQDIARIAGDIGPFELLEARLLIEPECAAYAAQKGTDEHLTKIREAQEALSEAGAPSHYDRAFHAAIAAACGNSALEAVVMHIWDLSEASPVYQRLDKHFVDSKVWDVALHEHDRISDAILDRDPIRARHAMYAHLLAIMARLREDFADSLPDADASTQPIAASRVRAFRRVNVANFASSRSGPTAERASRRKL
ncbi:FadR/GntR family transcriptional regulator [Polaromonas jejuensis]|uniref:FadR/GntR family transcriptional regulator n=1 Tax=Polaromonas jejuensis TaxID=457502 RepID=A0ABW0QJ33_9BURK|nr:FadR/GntR family transcriptional regulator [Polaromonas jejuensis]